MEKNHPNRKVSFSVFQFQENTLICISAKFYIIQFQN